MDAQESAAIGPRHAQHAGTAPVTARSHGGSSRVIGVITALMCALAAGAVWCVIALHVYLDLVFFAVPLAIIVAWALRSNGFARSALGAAIAASFTLIAFVYSGYLLAAAKVAAFLGMSLRSTVMSIGPEMAGAVAWADLTGWRIATILVAIALSAWLVWRPQRA